MFRKIESCLLSSAFILSFSMAAATPQKNDLVGMKEGTNAKVWTTYSTMKVMRDKHDYEALGDKLIIEMAKNETEGAQIVITPNTDIGSYDVIVSDLKCGDNVIKGEDIAIWQQNYVHVTSKGVRNYNDDYPAGWIPDFMLPLDIAKAYGENKISENCNQSVTVEVETTEETVAGKYTGTVTVIADAQEYVMPIEVTVWDITLHSTSRTCFSIARAYFYYGELDNSVETEDAYYAALLDYKCNGFFVPGESESPELMKEYLDKYWDHPNFNTYSLPALNAYGDNTVNIRYYKQYLKYLASKSTPERNYLEKAIVYVEPLDEPQLTNKIGMVDGELSKMRAAAEEVISELAAEGYYSGFENADEWKAVLEDTIRNIQLILTDTYRSEYQNADATLCPTFDLYSADDTVTALTDYATENDNEMWWYGCNNPKYPFPTYHIDDSLIGTRAVGWMQKQYGITGNLYWRVNQFHQQFVDLSPADKGLDPYVETNRIGKSSEVSSNGEGYLFYPGKKYGSDTPFPSLRLLNVRDGNDDYDLLSVLEQKYSELEKYYGVEKGTFSLQNTLGNLFDSIGVNVQYSQDPEAIFAARRLVAKLIEAAEKTGLVICNTKIADGQVKNAFYLEKNVEAEVDGGAVIGTEKGEGYCYTLASEASQTETNLFTLRVTKDAETIDFSFVVCGALNKLIDYEKENAEQLFIVTEDSTCSVDNTSKTAIFNMVGKGETLVEQIIFTPMISVPKASFDVNCFDQIDTISFTITNTSDRTEKVEIGFKDEKENEIVLLKVSIPAGEMKEINLKNCGGRFTSYYNKADTFYLKFENVDDNNNLLPNRIFILSEIYFTEYAR